MTAYKNFREKTRRPPAYAAASIAVAVAAAGLAGCSTEDRISAETKQGWLKLDRGYAWCLYGSVKSGATTDCDWSTLTETSLASFTVLKSTTK